MELEQDNKCGHITFYRYLAMAMIIKDVDWKNDELITSSRQMYGGAFDQWIGYNTTPRDEQAMRSGSRLQLYAMKLNTLAVDSAEYLICYKYGVRMRASSDISFLRNRERNVKNLNRVREAYIRERDQNTVELPTADAQPKKKKKKKSLSLS
jgi:hypothetical protein